MQDLAAGGTLYGPLNYDLLFAGDTPKPVTGHAIAATDLTKYQVAVMLANGQISSDFTGVTDGAKCVIVAQPALSGQNVPFFEGGCFNDAALTWPAGTAFDTLAERVRFFKGTGIKIDTIHNA